MGKKFKLHRPSDLSNLRVNLPRTVTHDHSYGNLSPYFRALAEGKLVGTHCRACKKTYLPPRPDCPDCYKKTRWVTLPTKGRVATFAVVKYPGAGYEEDLETVGDSLPSIIVYIEIEGVDTKIMSRLLECDLSEVTKGMEVEARFAENPNLNCLDLYWVRVKK